MLWGLSGSERRIGHAALDEGSKCQSDPARVANEKRGAPLSPAAALRGRKVYRVRRARKVRKVRKVRVETRATAAPKANRDRKVQRVTRARR